MKHFLLLFFLPSLTFAQVPRTLERAPTSPPSSSREGTGPTLGGAMGGDTSIYGPPRGNEFPEQRMEIPAVIESFDNPPDEDKGPSNGDKGRTPLPETIPGINP